MSILIRVRSVYGRPAIYPANAGAQHLAAIAGTKTLKPGDIQHAIELGLQVQQEFANGDVLTLESQLDIVTDW